MSNTLVTQSGGGSVNKQDEVWLGVVTDNVTISADKPGSKDDFIFVNVNGQQRFHTDDADPGELSWTYNPATGVITFSQTLSDFDVSASWLY